MGTLSAQQASTANGPREAVLKFHQQLIDMGARALRERPPEDRYMGCGIFAFTRDEAKELRSLIRDFCDRIAGNSEQGAPIKDAVYCVNIQLFELTKNSTQAEPCSQGLTSSEPALC